MMTGVRNDVHLAEAISGLAQSLYGLLATFWIHPVLVTVYPNVWYVILLVAKTKMTQLIRMDD